MKSHNHYVSSGLLKNWSKDGNTVSTYRILVSHEGVPKWSQRSIEYSAFQNHLYTQIVGGKETDEFENWIAKEYETPALASIDRLIKNKQLTFENWYEIIRFIGLQDLRTPRNYLDCLQKWRAEMPSLLEKTLEKTVHDLETGQVNREQDRESSVNYFGGLFRVRTHDLGEVNKNEIGLSVDVDIDRELWISQQKHLLSGVAKKLLKHKWSVLYPAKGYSWPISDHPVLKLNYYRNGTYDFLGGWGNRNTEIYMPISPHHLIYTRIGSKLGPRRAASKKLTKQLIRFLIERSHRFIYAHKPIEGVEVIKPRIINPILFKKEKEEWESWHHNQSRLHFE